MLAKLPRTRERQPIRDRDHMQRATQPPVWDLPVRLFHWSLLPLVVTAWVSAEEGYMDVHAWCGYTALTLVSCRILWGLVGSQNARFRTFVRGPRAIIAYLRGGEESDRLLEILGTSSNMRRGGDMDETGAADESTTVDSTTVDSTAVDSAAVENATAGSTAVDSMTDGSAPADSTSAAPDSAEQTPPEGTR